MKLIKLWEKIGKQPLKITQHQDTFVQSGRDKFFVTGINYKSGKFIDLQAEKICCNSCKNNPNYNNGYAPLHTCDICTSTDHCEDDYYMWKFKR